MKWFRHQTDSHTDEKLALLQAEFGLEGYGFYWLTLEIIAKQMEPGSDKTFVEYPISFWRKSYEFSSKKLRKFAEFCSEFEIFTIKFSEKSLTIDCPNLLKYRDEWSRKKNKNSGVTPESLRSLLTDTDTEEEKKKKREREKGAHAHVDPPPEDQPPEPQQSGPKKTTYPSKGRSSYRTFKSCVEVYPGPVNEDEAWCAWCDMEDRGMLDEDMNFIRDQIILLAQEDEHWNSGFAPNFTKCIKNRAWRNKPFKRPNNGQFQAPPRATTQAQKNSQDREGMAIALLKAKEEKKNAESQQQHTPHAIDGVRPELPSGNDRSGPSAGTLGRLD